MHSVTSEFTVLVQKCIWIYFYALPSKCLGNFMESCTVSVLMSTIFCSMLIKFISAMSLQVEN